MDRNEVGMNITENIEVLYTQSHWKTYQLSVGHVRIPTKRAEALPYSVFSGSKCAVGNWNIV